MKGKTNDRKLKKNRFRVLLKLSITVSVIVFILSTAINIYINHFSKKYIYSSIEKIPSSQAVLVLGAQVLRHKAMSHVLYDRVTTGYELYQNKKASKILLSGDHGNKSYDEVNTMKYFYISNKVPEKDVFLDHAGFNTYNSMVRAKKVFLIQDVIIVTQRFHLSRAIFIAQKKGLNAVGFEADKRTYRNMWYNYIREYLANIKAFIDISIDREPHFLGKHIPITGDGRLSWD